MIKFYASGFASRTIVESRFRINIKQRFEYSYKPVFSALQNNSVWKFSAVFFQPAPVSYFKSPHVFVVHPANAWQNMRRRLKANALFNILPKCNLVFGKSLRPIWKNIRDAEAVWIFFTTNFTIFVKTNSQKLIAYLGGSQQQVFDQMKSLQIAHGIKIIFKQF